MSDRRVPGERAGAIAMSRTGIVLCGGRSSRMGRAKAWLPWFGRSMVEHVVDCLSPVVDEVIVVTSADLELPLLPASIVRDREPGLGPLAGIRCGLAAVDVCKSSGGDYAFVTSVDAPHLDSKFVESMFEIGMPAAPVSEGRVQVLSAIYPCNAWKIAANLLANEMRRPLQLLEAVGYKAVQTAASNRPAPWDGFNTPAEYLDAVRQRDARATACVELLGCAARRAEESRHVVPVGTLAEVLGRLPDSLSLIDSDRVARRHLVSLGGRDLVRDLTVPVGPDEHLSVIDALVGG